MLTQEPLEVWRAIKFIWGSVLPKVDDPYGSSVRYGMVDFGGTSARCIQYEVVDIMTAASS